jgi:hypothetical protein
MGKHRLETIEPVDGKLLGGLGEPTEPENEYPLQGENEEGQLERRSIKRRWPEPAEDHKQAIINRQTYLAATKNVDPEVNVKAFRALNDALAANHPKPTAPLVATQVNVGDNRNDHDRAIDRKRLAETEIAELRLQQERRELVSAETVRQSFEAISGNLRARLALLRKISPEGADLVVEALEQAAADIGKIVDV